MSRAQTSQTSELRIPDASDDDYQKFRSQTDLREPYRLPAEVLQNTKKKERAYDVSESPTIAFINPRSGGRAGPSLLKALRLGLGNGQVYDVSEDKPNSVLPVIWENLTKLEKSGDVRAPEIKKRLKIIACGGDGTVTWIMKVIKDLNLDPPPSIAVVPLGTGNDLSRTFKWGPVFNHKWIKSSITLYDHLKDVSDGIYKELDCWQINIRAPNKEYFADLPHSLVSSNEDGSAVSGCSWNYISLGMDAQSAYGFHHLREDHPRFASGRMINQFWYGFFGIKSGWFCCCNSLNPPVNRSVSIEIMNAKNQWMEVELTDSYKAIVIVNLQSYAGGRRIWGRSKLSKKEVEHGMKDPGLNDGLFEVVAFRTGWHTGLVLTGISHAVRLGQGKAARIKAKKLKGDAAGEVDSIYMQIDGEPWKQKIPTSEGEILSIDIVHNGTSSLLMREPRTRTKKTKETEAGPSAKSQGESV